MNENILKSILLDQQEAFWTRDTGIEREQLKILMKTASSPQTVVVSGLRRVGKSTLLLQLAHKLGKEKVHYVSFEDERLVGFKADQMNNLYEVLVELFGDRKILIFDEIQNVERWEMFVRRFIDLGYKFFLAGSNASLLSRELGTKLTGRYISLELFPFSFSEFLLFKKYPLLNLDRLSTKDKSVLSRHFNEYLKYGGIPDALKYPQLSLHKTLYDDILYRDIAARYQIGEVRALKELTFYIVSNSSGLFSFNKLKEWLRLGSVNTVKSYIEYLEMSWLIFVVNTYSYSVKKQQVAPKKIYCIDTGLINSVAFSFSENRGKLLENLVFLALRRKVKDIYYFKTRNGEEVDFYLPRTRQLIQVCQNLEQKETLEREVNALINAMDELNLSSGLILSETKKDKIKVGRKSILIQPIYEWL